MISERFQTNGVSLGFPQIKKSFLVTYLLLAPKELKQSLKDRQDMHANDHFHFHKSWTFSLVVVTSNMKLLLLLFLPFSFVNGVIKGKDDFPEHDHERSINIVNKSGRRMNVYWVNNIDSTKPEELVSQSEKGDGYPYGSDAHIKSYVGHTFEIQEMPGKKSKVCQQELCWTRRFQVTSGADQVVTIEAGFRMNHSDKNKRAKSKAQELIEQCQETAVDLQLAPLDKIEYIAKCTEEKVEDKTTEEEEEISVHSTIRLNLAQRIAPYACGQVNYTQSEAVGSSKSWSFEGTTYELEVYHERESSRILSVSDFVSPAECQAIKAFHDDKKANNVGNVQKRLSSFTSELMDSKELGVEEPWIERFFTLHEDPNHLHLPDQICGKDETDNDACQPFGAIPVEVETKSFHVDVEETYETLATAFMFCEEPINNQLGGIHFPNAGIHINPTPGTLVLAIHRELGEEKYDGFVQDYHFCPNHRLFTYEKSLQKP